MATRKEKKVEKVLRQPRKVFGDNPLARRQHKEPHPLAELFNRQEDQTLRRLTEPVDVQTSNDSNTLDVQTSTDSTNQTSNTQTYRRLKNPNPIDYEKSYRARDLSRHTLRLPTAYSKQVKDFCYKHNLEFQEFYTRLTEYFFSLPNIETSKILNLTLDVQTSHDDMMIFKTHEDIIMRFELYTNRKWTRRDDREGVRYNDTDIRLIEIAFIATIDKKLLGNTAKQPIKSFNYFTTEIDLLIQQQRDKELPANLDEYHKYVLSTWEKRIRKLRDAKWPQNA